MSRDSEAQVKKWKADNDTKYWSHRRTAQRMLAMKNKKSLEGFIVFFLIIVCKDAHGVW